MLHLAPIIGTGKRADPFRPRGVDGMRGGWGMLDLRDDASKPGGWCYLWTNDKLTLERGTVRIGCDPLEAMTRSAVYDTRSRLGVCTQGRRLLRDMLAKLLFWRWLRWGNVSRWNPVQPENWTGLREIWMCGKLWAWTRARPKCCPDLDPSDTFIRSNETPLAGNWARLTGSTNNINLASNTIASSAAGDKFYYYTNGANHADQWSEIRQNSQVTNDDWGPAVRVGASGFSGYWVAGTVPSGFAKSQFNKFVSGSYTEIASADKTRQANGDILRTTIAGSTLSGSVNGTANSNSPQTDTSLTTAGNGIGVFIYDTGGGLNNWQGSNYRPGPWYNPGAGMRAMLATM